MKTVLIYIFILIFVHCTKDVYAKGRYNISYAQLDTCDEYDISNGGYEYRDFFLVHSLDNNQIGVNERLHLKFYVITSKDAHILLSVTNQPRIDDRVYEIVIGAGENTFSAIRTRMGRRRVATNQDPKLLSPYDPTPIEIVLTKEAHVLVYIPGFKKEPLLNFTDASALSINYISFSSFGLTTARWFYDCEFDGFSHELEPETRTLSVEQRLIANIAEQAQNMSLPANLSSVEFAFQVRSVTFEQAGAILRTRMHFIVYWQDERLKWEPKEYSNITELVRPRLEIWTPDIVVFNAALETLGSLIVNSEIKVQHNGSIALLARDLEIASWCIDSERNWPHERLNCHIKLGINELNSNNNVISLVYDLMRPLTKEAVNTLSEWYFDEIGVSSLKNESSTRYSVAGLAQARDGDAIIEFTLKRNSNFYTNVFTMPIFACQTFIILSFLLRGYRRGALLLVVLVLSALALMFITKHAMPQYVPNIMITYVHIMHVVVISYFLHVCILWLELFPPKTKPAPWLMVFINCSPLRAALCLQFADAADYVTIQEKPWAELSKICNSLCFIVINIFFIITSTSLLPAA